VGHYRLSLGEKMIFQNENLAWWKAYLVFLKNAARNMKDEVWRQVTWQDIRYACRQIEKLERQILGPKVK